LSGTEKSLRGASFAEGRGTGALDVLSLRRGRQGAKLIGRWFDIQRPEGSSQMEKKKKSRQHKKILNALSWM
jgi:hypothetical protein